MNHDPDNYEEIARLRKHLVILFNATVIPRATEKLENREENLWGVIHESDRRGRGGATPLPAGTLAWAKGPGNTPETGTMAPNMRERLFPQGRAGSGTWEGG